MEIKGEEFIKKVQLQQERDEIEQRLSEINSQEAEFAQRSQPNQVPPRMNNNMGIEEELEYSDLKLGGNSEKNNANKKKYLILGLVLVILFLLTIIIIRLLTNDSVENDSFSNANTQNKVLENDNIEEQYQKIINEKLKNIKEEKEKPIIPENKVESLDLKKIEEKEIVEKPKAVKPNIFEVKESKPIEVKKAPVIKKIESKPKPVVTKKVQTVSSSTITSKPKGTFVQVGAFSKMPSKEYLDSISKKGFSYKVYKVSINNKMFHKVLIGPYNSRGQANLMINDIKKKLNINGAFILTF